VDPVKKTIQINSHLLPEWIGGITASEVPLIFPKLLKYLAVVRYEIWERHACVAIDDMIRLVHDPSHSVPPLSTHL
jgi:hypothetical protein